MQPIPESVRGITTLDIPDGANPSKIATWVQRLAVDGNMPEECPDDQHNAVHLGAMSLNADPSKALAIDMTGNPIGDKMLTRLEGTAGDTAWLVFGLTDDGGTEG
jgi:hypothetical protein